MRKLLAVLLAAIMLVGAFAALPAGATVAATSGFDGTTSADTPELVITEILINSKTGDPRLDDQLKDGDVANISSPDAFDYIEIYNKSDREIHLYDYKIVAAPGSSFADKKEGSATSGRFTRELDLGKWELRSNPNATGVSFGEYDVFLNPDDDALMPGEFAIIWFYGDGATQLTNLTKKLLTKDDFIKHYDMPEDTLLVAVPGKASKGSSFELTLNYTYALVQDDFTCNESVVVNPWGNGGTAALTDNGRLIECMADYSRHTKVGMTTESNMDDQSAYYVPADCVPDILNKINEQVDGAAYQKLNSYVEAEYTQSYRGSAIVSFTEVPSPGTMPAWQWAYVDPVGGTGNILGTPYTRGLQFSEAAAANNAATYEETMKALVTDWEENSEIKKEGRLNIDATNDGGVAWSAACLKTLIDTRSDAITGEGGATEEKIDYKKLFISREELERRHNKKNNGGANEEEFPTWALILIIVGGVVLLGGIAVVVIIVIKKKNKPVAADDVATEGEIEIVDETDETATIEAPADETTNE